MNAVFTRVVSAAAFVLSLATSTAAQDGFRIVDGRVDVRDHAFKPVFIDDFKIYPGTKVTLDVEFRVDVMRRMYETRECWSKWFGGIWCEYIKRSDGSGIQEDRSPLVLELLERRQDGSPAIAAPSSTSPVRVGEGTDPFDVSSHLPALTRTFSIELEDAAIQDTYTRGYVLKGRVANKYKAGDSYLDIVRRSCDPHRSNEFCSQGQYVVHIRAVDTSSREKLLERYLARKRSYSEIASTDVIDHFMKSEVIDRTIKTRVRVVRAAELLVQHARTHHRAEGGVRNEDLRQILEYAVSLDQENVDARNDLVRYHIESGSLAQAKEKGAENLKKFNEAYGRGDREPTTLRGLGQTLRNGGQVMLKDRAATDLIDVEVANGFYERALAIWSEYETLGYPINTSERLEIAQVYVDQARILSLIRTKTALQRAIKKLETARLQLPRVGRGTPAAVSSDGLHFMTASFFQPLAEVGNSRVMVGYLPLEESLPIQIRHSTGEVLFSRLDEGGRPSYTRWSLQSGTTSPETIVLPAMGLHMRGGRLFGKGLIGLDHDTGNLVRVEGGKRDILASKISENARWTSATEAAVAVLAPAVDGEAVSIWYEGKTLALDTGAAVIEGVAVSPAGKHVQLLQKSDKGLELRLVDVDKLAKGDPTASVVHGFDVPAFGMAELSFTQDGQFALQRSDRLLIVAPVGAGEPKIVKLAFDASSPVQAIDGKRLVIIPREDTGMVGALTILDAGAAHASGAALKDHANAPSPPVETLTFFAQVPSEGLIVTSPAGKVGGSTGPLTILVKVLPAVLHVHSFKGGPSLEARVPAYRHGDAVLMPGGVHMALRDRSTGKVRLSNLKDARLIREFPDGLSAKGEPLSEIIPMLGSATGGFFHIARDHESSAVLSITTYLDAEKDGKRHNLQPSGLPAGVTPSWRLLRQPSGHLSPDQPSVIVVSHGSRMSAADPLLSREEHDATLAKLSPAVVVVTEVDRSGEISSVNMEIRDPGSIVAKVGTNLLQRRETGFAFSGSKGQPIYLDECGPKTRVGECDGGRLQFLGDGRSVILARQGPEKLEVSQWTVGEDGGVDAEWRCKLCSSIGTNVFASLASNFIGALPETRFAMGPDRQILAPYQDALGSGLPKDGKWSRKIPFARPVALGVETALVQRDGATFEMWRLR